MIKARKGQVTVFISFFIIAFVILVLAALVAPFGIDSSVQFYLAGESIINNTQVRVEQIQDADVKAHVKDVIQGAKDNTQTNIDVYGSLYQYGWVVALVLTALVVFLATRRNVDYGGGLS